MSKRILSVLLAVTMLLMSNMTVLASEPVAEQEVTPLIMYSVNLPSTTSFVKVTTVDSLLDIIQITNSYVNPGAIRVFVIDSRGALVQAPQIVELGETVTITVNQLLYVGPYTVYAAPVTTPGTYNIDVTMVGI